jgi:enoyl-CoA hydratase
LIGKYDYVTIEVVNQIATLRIADPNDDRFAVDGHPMHRELRDVIPVLATRQDVRALVVAGGESQFCPAPDLTNLDRLLASDEGAAERLQDEASAIVSNLLAFPKPTVAALAHPALGFGAQVALSCDFLVTHPNAILQDSHVRLGLAAGDGATLVWPMSVGLPRARRHILRGVPLSGADADQYGLVELLVDTPAEVLAASLALAGRLTRLAPEAYAATKAALNGWLTGVQELVLTPVNRAQIQSYRSAEFEAHLSAARSR